MLPRRPTVLIVEDEATIADTLVYALKTEGFEPVWKSTGAAALVILGEDRAVELVILDIGLPDVSGFEVCRQIRRVSSVPILFLTARNDEVDRVVGLELGADDYVAKPFSPREVTARVKAILRRSGGAKENGERAGALEAPDAEHENAAVWVHDEPRCRISYRGRCLDLTRNEYRLLGVLVGAPGRVFSREQLMKAAWDDPGAALDRTVDAHVKMVRAKLKALGMADAADLIVTHRGLGYSLRET